MITKEEENKKSMLAPPYAVCERIKSNTPGVVVRYILPLFLVTSPLLSFSIQSCYAFLRPAVI
jgi:hypothetical protein